MKTPNSAKRRFKKAWMLDGGRVLPLTLVATAALIFAALVACAGREESASSANNAQQPATPADWKPVEQALGKSGAMQPGDVFKVSLPRSDLKVSVRGVQVKPALALGSWV